MMAKASWKEIEDRSRILNLGSGNRIIPKAVNHDLTAHRPEISRCWDLNRLPWPWADNQFLWIEAWAILEHLDIDLLTSINECWRILEAGGILKLKVPWAGNPLAAWRDPTHRWASTIETFAMFDPATEWGQHAEWYTQRKWKLEYNKLNPEKTSVMVRMRKRGM